MRYTYNGSSKVTIRSKSGNSLLLEAGTQFAVVKGIINGEFNVNPKMLEKLLGLSSRVPKPTKVNAEDFYNLLQVSPMEENKRSSILQLRIAKLGFPKVCGRCGGSGHYSFNLMHGTKCYGCNGSGYVTQKLTADLYDKLSDAVDKGLLQEYFDKRDEQQKYKNVAKLASVFLDKWSECKISKEYDWMKAGQSIQPDKDISQLINAPIANHYDKLTKMHSDILGLQFKDSRAKTSEEREKIQEQLLEKSKLMKDTYDEGVKLIEEKMKLLPAIKERYMQK